MKYLTKDYIRRADKKGILIFHRDDAPEKYLVIPPKTKPKQWKRDLSADDVAKIIDGEDNADKD